LTGKRSEKGYLVKAISTRVGIKPDYPNRQDLEIDQLFGLAGRRDSVHVNLVYFRAQMKNQDKEEDQELGKMAVGPGKSE
jgi:hypothetical protein